MKNIIESYIGERRCTEAWKLIEKLRTHDRQGIPVTRITTKSQSYLLRTDESFSKIKPICKFWENP